MFSAFAYIVRRRDGSYYVGSARGDLEKRVAEHNAGTYGGSTSRRKPVELVWPGEFQQITDAISAERQIKGWSRAKKEALIRGDENALVLLARRRTPFMRSAGMTLDHQGASFETAASRPPQDED
jgi:putative endonuclease